MPRKTASPKSAPDEILTAPPPPKFLIPVTKWEAYHPWPSKCGLRALIFNAETNGFHRAFLKIGGRVLVDEAEFFKAIDEIAARRPLQRGNKRGVPVPMAKAGGA